jgi:hypothetical protein
MQVSSEKRVPKTGKWGRSNSISLRARGAWHSWNFRYRLSENDTLAFHADVYDLGLALRQEDVLPLMRLA